jgi:hypothetical protein
VQGERAVGLLYGHRALMFGALNPIAFIGATRFTLEDVRKVPGRLSGISLAQWARAGKVKKTAAGYEKIIA